VPRFGVTGAVCAPCLYRRKGSYVAGLNGLIRKNFGKMFGEQLVLDAGLDATPSHAPLFLYPTGEPTTDAEGGIYFDDTAEALRWYDGSAYQTAASLEHAAQTFTGNVTVSGNLAVTGTSALTGLVSGPRKVYNAVTTLTAADSGAFCIWGTAAGYTYTLPAAAAGLWFDFLVGITITSSAAKVVTASGDFLLGNFIQSTDGTYTSASHAADGSTITSWNGNGTTTGGLVGDWLRVVAISGTQWYVHGMGRATGAEATPFATS
jgi:hypothetical protein